jgi:hypothetical protein
MSWDPLPYPEWQPTVRSLHRWSQIAGKLRMALAAPMNHWWHVTLYVSVRGLTTSPIPYRDGLVELEFDLKDHRLVLSTSAGAVTSVALRPVSVAGFYAEVRQLLADADVDAPIWPVPVEVEDATPFEEDTAGGAYDRGHARALHDALLNCQRVLARFRGGFQGKASPVHFFWGGFDIATTRFSGRRAPLHPGGAPNCPAYVMAEAYSHEVSSAGWWPGTGEVGPSFYAYMYPEPAGYGSASLRPAPGEYHGGLGEFILPYQEAARSADPDETVLAFLEATYAAGATLAGWDRAGLERRRVPVAVSAPPAPAR